MFLSGLQMLLSHFTSMAAAVVTTTLVCGVVITCQPLPEHPEFLVAQTNAPRSNYGLGLMVFQSVR